MPNKYFKPHEAFDLNPHPYDVGVFTGLKSGYEDNLFIKKLFTLPELQSCAGHGDIGKTHKFPKISSLDRQVAYAKDLARNYRRSARGN